MKIDEDVQGFGVTFHYQLSVIVYWVMWMILDDLSITCRDTITDSSPGNVDDFLLSAPVVIVHLVMWMILDDLSRVTRSTIVTKLLAIVKHPIAPTYA